MNGNGPYMVFYIMAAVFVASSLFAMRMPLGKALKMALAWVAIFGVAFLLFAFRGEFSQLVQRIRAEATGSPIVEGETVRIPVAEDGHFYVDAKLNGHDVRFMVDSGASVTTVSRSTANAAGMEIGTRRGVVITANGPASVMQSSADRLQVGSIERTDFPVDVSEQEGLNLLGMNFLRSLQGWRVEGNYLVLQP
ncbi:MAG TPA: TIGR02281 family clan AA aspartic protease [Sphingomicrobium sp.]|nr:TIGR02281 family clan AA aspartic protease [Sphingomicrobium sp.]